MERLAVYWGVNIVCFAGDIAYTVVQKIETGLFTLVSNSENDEK